MTRNGITAGSYQYDGRGLRTVKTVSGETRLFVYCKSGKLIAEADSDGNITKEYVYLEGNIFAHFLYDVPAPAPSESAGGSEPLPETAPEPVAANNPPAVAEASTPSDTAFLQAVYMLLLMKDKSAEGAYYYIDNHLGAPQVITDDSGAVVWKAEYLPFGKVNISVAQVENNLRFPGQYYDAETGLHYNWNRFYDPETGRYISADPIGLDGGMNLFAYVGGNPIGKIDYKGLTPLYPGQGVPLDMSVSVPVQVKCCEGYRPYFNSKCENECGDEVENTYPERAYIICLDFIKKYKSSSRVRGVAHCLISEEAKCQGEKKCALRNKCRFNAHIKCYSKYAFLEPFNPFGPGFPDGGPELGWEELFPDWWNN